MLAELPERPKIADAPLSVVLLPSSAGTDLQAVLTDWLGWLGQRPSESEILLVRDNSADGSVPEGLDPRIRLIQHVSLPGLGPALQSAVWMARHPLLQISTADQQFSPSDV